MKLDRKQIVWIPIILIGSLYAIYLVPQMFGMDVYVVESGSMEPTIPQGSIIFNRDTTAAGIQEGDIISYIPNQSVIDEEKVTHRVIDVEQGNFTEVYTTQGDANAEPDPEPVPFYRVTGLTEFWIPYLGYVLTGIYSLPALVAFLILPAAYLMKQEISRLAEHLESDEKRRIPARESES